MSNWALKNKSDTKPRDSGQTGMAKTSIAVEPQRQTSKQPGDPAGDHLIGLADGWTTWRTFCVRGTGFPVSMLEPLAAPDAVSAVDKLIDRKAVYDQAVDQAQVRCRQLLKNPTGDTRAPLRRVLRQLTKGRAPNPLPDLPALKSSLETLVLTTCQKDAAQKEAESCVARALADTANALRQSGRDARFREAVTWQNRKALVEGIDVLLRTPPEVRNAQARRHEQLIVSYLQRYCAKNETIGFFGPLGWASWSEQGPPLVQLPGTELVTARKLHFEYWAVNSIAETIATDLRLHKWLPPRINPSIRIDGDTLVNAREVGKPLPPDTMRVLAACDGDTTATDIAATLVADPECGLQAASDVYHQLTQAAQAGLICWTLEVPVGPNPWQRLKKTLSQIGDPDLRSKLMSRLDELETARRAVVASRGNANALNRALGELEALFTQCTGKGPYQNPGRIYAGRSLVYEDCRRQTEIEIGPEIRRQFGPPLALVLQSARWFSHTIAARFEKHLKQLHKKLQADFAPRPVSATAVEFLFDRQNTVVRSIVEAAASELTERWASILLDNVKMGTRRHQLSTEKLKSQVLSSFEAPTPGWLGARHHSADILIAAEGAKDAEAGRCHCVLGEVHVNDTMIMRQLFQDTHPRPKDLLDAYQTDIQESQIFRITPRNYQGHRKVWDPFLARDLQIASDSSPPWRPKEEVLRVSDLIIEDSANGLVVRTRDNTRSFPALVYFERLLWRESFTSFRLLPGAPHTPRITVGDLVVKRESWRISCRDLTFLHAKSETDRFIGARFWAHRLGLPRWVFARFPQEFKPVYVDLESPASVEAMVKLGRRALDLAGKAAELGLSEMLPNPNQSWLTDAKGNLYTSELRIVAVDPKAWQPPGPYTPQ